MYMSTMGDEIREQPAAIERTLREEWSHTEQLRKHFETHPVRLIVLVARGTSDNAAQFGRYLLEITTGIPVSLGAPSIQTLYRSQVNYKDTVVVALSQSGESTDTNLVLEQAKASGAFTIGITNEASSSLAKLAHHTFLVRAGKEKSVAATKTYTGQLACMYLVAHALGAKISFEQLAKLPDYASAAIGIESTVKERAERYRFMNHAVCIGRGLNYSNSFELSLKLMETCYVVAERFSSADLLHGPIAMLEDSFPAFLFCPAGVTWKPICEMIEKLKGIRAETLVIADESTPLPNEGPAQFGRSIVIPARLGHNGNDLPEDVWTAIPYIIPGQMLAASLAEIKGLNPDQPRTLSKVTQTL